MKKSLFFSLVLAVICCMSSCTKHSTPNSIVFGNTDGMIVKTYDSTDLAYHHHSETSYYYEDYTCRCIIDINNDGIEDIGIVSSRATNWDFPNHEFISVTRIELDQNTCVSCENVFHSEFYHLDSTYTTAGDTIINYYTSYCVKTSDDDVYSEYSSMFVDNTIPYHKGDRISKKDYFYWPTNNNLYTQPHYSFPTPYFNDNNIVVKDVYYNSQFDCYNFPLDEETYVGVKITEKDGNERLGWIKIYLESLPDGTHKLTQLETAIQK